MMRIFATTVRRQSSVNALYEAARDEAASRAKLTTDRPFSEECLKFIHSGEREFHINELSESDKDFVKFVSDNECIGRAVLIDAWMFFHSAKEQIESVSVYGETIYAAPVHYGGSSVYYFHGYHMGLVSICDCGFYSVILRDGTVVKFTDERYDGDEVIVEYKVVPCWYEQGTMKEFAVKHKRVYHDRAFRDGMRSRRKFRKNIRKIREYIERSIVRADDGCSYIKYQLSFPLSNGNVDSIRRNMKYVVGGDLGIDYITDDDIDYFREEHGIDLNEKYGHQIDRIKKLTKERYPDGYSERDYKEVASKLYPKLFVMRFRDAEEFLSRGYKAFK